MRRRLAMLSAVVLVSAGALGPGPTNPASATNVCAGLGTATVTPGLLAPIVPLTGSLPSLNTSIWLLLDALETSAFVFGIGPTGGICTSGTATQTITATGTVNGYCGHSAGSGVDDQGHVFGWVGVGTLLVITGELTGAVIANPNPTNPSTSCFNGHGGATDFIVTGAVLRTNCAGSNTLTTLLTTVPVVPSLGLPLYTIPIVNINVHVGGFAVNVHGSAHACVGIPTKL